MNTHEAQSEQTAPPGTVHYDASGAQYIACIETALQHGQSIPVHVLQLVYHMLLPYMHN